MSFKKILRFFVPRGLRNFLRAPVKSVRCGTQGLLYGFFKKGRMCSILPDWTVSCHPSAYQDFRLHGQVPELKAELDAFISRARSGMILLDIGSHYGFFTLAALHFGGPSARVIAVDPSPEVREIFLANLDLNGVRNRVHFVEAAAGSSAVIPMLSTGSFGEHMFIADSGHSDAVPVKGVTIPSIIEESSMEPTHLKIDVEGHESRVIQGGEKYLTKYRPVIFLELHCKLIRKAGENPEDTVNLLREIGYEFEHNGRRVLEEEIYKEDIFRFVCVPRK